MSKEPTTGDPPPKPRYLGALNAICAGEADAERYFKAWADTTRDLELKRILAFVSEREGTHSRVLRQRIERMGYSARPKRDQGADERAAIYGDPELSDMEKLRWKMQRDGEANYGIYDDFSFVRQLLVDPAVDDLTKDTLRWYLSEELDTNNLLRISFSEVERRSVATRTS
jgi:rubrerythrin